MDLLSLFNPGADVEPGGPFNPGGGIIPGALVKPGGALRPGGRAGATMFLKSLLGGAPIVDAEPKSETSVPIDEVNPGEPEGIIEASFRFCWNRI